MWGGLPVLRLFVVFFFKQKTAYDMRISDCSSDVCSSDLDPGGMFVGRGEVDMQLHDEVRRHDDSTPPRRLGHLQERRETADARRVMHDHVYRPAQIARASCRGRVWPYV